AINNLKISAPIHRILSYSLFSAAFLWCNFWYLKAGASNLYMTSAQSAATSFKNAITADVVHPNTHTVYIVEKQKDPNGENALLWAIGNGDLFKFYQGSNKKIIFVDSVYQRMQNHSDSMLEHFNRNTDQIVSLDKTVTDLTSNF